MFKFLLGDWLFCLRFFNRFTAQKVCTTCSGTSYKIVPLTNLNKYLYNYTSETELNINISVNNSSEKCLRIFVIYFSYFRQTDAEYIKLCYNHFLLNCFQCIIH